MLLQIGTIGYSTTPVPVWPEALPVLPILPTIPLAPAPLVPAPPVSRRGPGVRETPRP